MSYVSKLLSGRSYVAKSHGSSVSRLPSASIQHPFLLPPVLDVIFPYMTLEDLKKCRLVCSTWNAVIIPLIARRQLHPVDFSAISHQDFLALKSEFLKFPGKVQFFQGIQVKWAEINTIFWSKFLEFVKPRALVISGGVVTDQCNLSQLLLPVTTTLTHLSLEAAWEPSNSCPPFTNLFNKLADLEPLTLKSLCLKMGELANEESLETLYNLKLALEKFLQSQSQTLEELEISFLWYIQKPEVFRVEALQIKWPIFLRLRSLDLNLEMEKDFLGVYLPILAPFDFNVKFPQLDQMTIQDELLFELKAFDSTRGHPLKKLEFVGDFLFTEAEFRDLLVALYSSFPHLEEFRTTENLDLDNVGILILWVDTLRILDVSGIRQDFDFKHLKKLEHLHHRVYPNDENIDLSSAPMIELLSEHHLQLPLLKSFHLTYHKKYMTEERRDEILEGVPAEFRAILTIDLV